MELIPVKQLEKDFLPWLSDILQVIFRIQQGDTAAAAEVPCGTCTLCCEGNIRTVLTDEEAVNPLYCAVEVQASFPPDGNKTTTADGTLVHGPIDVAWIIPKVDGKCIHLTQHGCTIHDELPRVCRSFDCRKRIVTDMADSATVEMGLQWDMDRWNTEENKLILRAIRVAAIHRHQSDPEMGIGELTGYAFEHFAKYLGPVYLDMESEK